MTSRKKVFITGGSSGLGRQMAIEFTSRGYDVALAARRLEALQALKDELALINDTNVLIYTLDVTDFDSVEPTIFQIAEDMGGLDIVVANSGIGKATTVGVKDFSITRATIETNVIGAMATIDAAVKIFLKQGFGQVVGISSVAGFRGFPHTGAYAASKAALTVYLQSLRAELWTKGITVTDLAPGYIMSEMTDDGYKRPFLISLEKGGRILVNLIEKKVAFSTVPRWPWVVVSKVLRLIPASMLAYRPK
ncbi:MAG: SDR family oxidoreductase [Kordiimonadaceae bacterium]|nr:SDR family oxidoreductase [Kordiimonadaceae bacterium]